jgi:hypothetical protein
MLTSVTYTDLNIAQKPEFHDSRRIFSVVHTLHFTVAGAPHVVRHI